MTRRMVVALAFCAALAMVVTACSVPDVIRSVWRIRGHSEATTEWAVRIAHCESRFRPETNSPGSGRYKGIFQQGPYEYERHGPSHGPHDPMSFTFDQVRDPFVASVVAARTYESPRGFRPWECRTIVGAPVR